MSEHKNKQLGFTLIELMIVIAIIGILATIAVPQYVKFSKRAKFTEVVLLIERYKTPAEIAFQVAEKPISSLTSGAFGIPADLGPGDSTSSYLQSAGIDAGKITVTATADLDDATFVLQAANPAGTSGLRWNFVSSESTCIDAGLCSPSN